MNSPPLTRKNSRLGRDASNVAFAGQMVINPFNEQSPAPMGLGPGGSYMNDMAGYAKQPGSSYVNQ